MRRWCWPFESVRTRARPGSSSSDRNSRSRLRPSANSTWSGSGSVRRPSSRPAGSAGPRRSDPAAHLDRRIPAVHAEDLRSGRAMGGKPISILRVVVLPAPFGPSNAQAVPAGSCQSRWSTTARSS
jgi:hypothetical protein